MNSNLEKLRALQQQMQAVAKSIEEGKMDSATATNRIGEIRRQMDQIQDKSSAEILSRVQSN
jgi:uncharacterized membrane protein (DUF106 family)